MEMPTKRSVWGTSTDDFKNLFRDYLREMQGDDQDRDNLISRVMWCIDVWDKHRNDYFPDNRCHQALNFPFFEFPGLAGANEEPAKYKLIGSAGQPSVIEIRHNLMMGTSDLTIWKSGDGERRLVLKKDHPKRDAYIERLIVHQLLHQFLVEAAPDFIRSEYTHQTRNGAAGTGGEFKTYKGHGNLFARFADQLSSDNGMTLLGDDFEVVPLRHYKVRNAAASDRQRPSCSWFCTLDMFFVWDPDAEGLTEEQLTENKVRMDQALAWYDGAVELVETEKPPVENFEAPFDSSCADVCINELNAYDEANGTNCLEAFVRRIADFAVPSVESTEIPPSARVEEPTQRVKTPPCPFSVGDKVRHPAKGECQVTHLFAPVDGNGWNVGVLTASGQKEITPASSLTPNADVPTDGDTAEKPTLRSKYPLDNAKVSLALLETDLAAAKKNKVTYAQFAHQRFGHSDGAQLSRHRKALREAAA